MKTSHKKICNVCQKNFVEFHKHMCSSCRLERDRAREKNKNSNRKTKERFCKKCGILVGKGKSICPSCLVRPDGLVKKICELCGVEIPGTRHYCISCSGIHKKDARREKYLTKEKPVLDANRDKTCVDCGCRLCAGIRTKVRCDECEEKKLIEIRENRVKRYYLEHVRYCPGCGVLVLQKNNRYCPECRTERRRKRGAEYSKHRRINPETRDTVKEWNKISRGKKAARRHAATRDFTAGQWRDVRCDFLQTCAYCGKPEKHLQQDHFFPAMSGGGYTASNILPACPDCNKRKTYFHPLAWLVMQEHGLLKYVRLSNYLAQKIF
jgi:hypothetical protein